MNLSGFLTFWMKHSEEEFKRYRRLLEASFVSGAPSENVSFLLFLHSYVVAGNEPGVLYEVIGCHKTGVTKKQVLDAIALAFVHAGPMGMNGIAKGTDEYLDKWTSDPPLRVKYGRRAGTLMAKRSSLDSIFQSRAWWQRRSTALAIGTSLIKAKCPTMSFVPG